MATILFWIMAGFVALASFLTVAYVGKPREPIAPWIAAWTLLLNALQVLALVYIWRH